MFKKEFDTSYVGFMKDGAEWLVKNTDIKLIGEILPLKILKIFNQFWFLLAQHRELVVFVTCLSILKCRN